MLNNPKSIIDIMKNVFHANKLAEEYVWIIALNTKCYPIGIFEVSHGTVNMSLVRNREIFIRLLLSGASSEARIPLL